MPLSSDGTAATDHQSPNLLRFYRVTTGSRDRPSASPGIIALTAAAESALQTPPPTEPRRPSHSAPSANRSATRNALRPPDSATNASGATASVHLAGNDRWTPPSSNKNTRSSPHAGRIATNTNSRPTHGWNGCVTRTRCSTAASSAVDSDGQRRLRDVPRQPQEGADLPAIVADPRRGQSRGVRVHRGLVQPPAPALHPRLPLPSRVRAPARSNSALRDPISANRSVASIAPRASDGLTTRRVSTVGVDFAGQRLDLSRERHRRSNRSRSGRDGRWSRDERHSLASPLVVKEQAR